MLSDALNLESSQKSIKKRNKCVLVMTNDQIKLTRSGGDEKEKVTEKRAAVLFLKENFRDLHFLKC
ncbi:DRBM domain-containing protein [Caenorhabditis elegans]|uniref:DRBM domain-containing protein n=1 Tax=Caenorhabditis elegans TaxID=6239 RepID=D3DEM0_CAEEL|nr:DRBM domain-containing protein [Caenorhabditis elegans]CBJ25102.1 DRBM domain-containing protein [Caenorhabditis elegans]|eukprot:NP_001255878.1 Uncharacterized protein CELE_Y105C5A.1273 [Caenorhabditis elegans]